MQLHLGFHRKHKLTPSDDSSVTEERLEEKKRHKHQVLCTSLIIGADFFIALFIAGLLPLPLHYISHAITNRTTIKVKCLTQLQEHNTVPQSGLEPGV